MSLTKPTKQKLKKKIIALLSSQPAQKYKSKSIARSLGISNNNYIDFRDFLRELSRSGEITKAGTNAYKSIQKRLAGCW